MRTRIKICGLTRAEDAALALQLGADALGVVLVPGSRRLASPAAAREIGRLARGLVPLVALVADAPAAAVREIIAGLRPDLLQFHGSEPPEFCDGFGWPYLKALSHRVARREAPRYPAARGLVVDSHAPGALGGTGRVFDWADFPGDIQRPLLLAGGLDPRNVGEAVRRARPYGVDVSSGVERAPGVKDPLEIERFIQEVIRVDCSQPAS